MVLSNLRGVIDNFNIAGIAGLVMRRRKQKLEIIKLKFKTLINRPRKVAYKYLYLPQMLMRIRHRREMLRFYSQFINQGDLCFDVGANLGNKTETFLKLGATVVAIEPQSVCMQQLKKKYHKNSRVILIQKALGEKEGERELFLSPAHTISSMSKEWINSVKSSVRFRNYTWNKSVTVPMTTLDKLIEEIGKPSFCKIDVEGFEFQVLKGLSQPIRTLSFEFTPEFIDSAIHCIEHLSKIGLVKFNYSVGESMRLALPTWVTNDEMCKILTNLPDKTIFGDVYAKNISNHHKLCSNKFSYDKQYCSYGIAIYQEQSPLVNICLMRAL